MRDEYKKRRDTLCRKFGEIPGVVFDVPGGAFYVMAALPVDDADKFQQWLLEEFSDNGETVMMAPGGSMYATPGKGKTKSAWPTSSKATSSSAPWISSKRPLRNTIGLERETKAN